MKHSTQKQARAERLTTPIGTAVYPYLNKPDTKFDDEGKFRVRLRIPEEEAGELLAKIQEQYDESYKEFCSREGVRKLKTASTPWRNAVDEDGKETGEIEFNFSSKASGVNKETKEAWTRTIPLFDSKRKPLSKSLVVGNGSQCRVSFFISPFYTKLLGFGISLRLVGVQVTEFVAGGGNTAESMGFGDEEGWESDEDEVTAKEDADEESEEEETENEDLELSEEEETPKSKPKGDRFGLDKSIAKLNRPKATAKAKPKPAAKAKPKAGKKKAR